MVKTTVSVEGMEVPAFSANTIIVGAGAAGMNAAVRLVEFWARKGVADPAERLCVVTRGLGLGASRMSGSDKQTYYKMGTSPRTPDTAVDFAKTLTASGCCHGDTALVEGLCSLRSFHHLVEAGVPFLWHLKLVKAGGLDRMLAAAASFRAAGHDVMVGQMNEGNLATAAALSAAAAIAPPFAELYGADGLSDDPACPLHYGGGRVRAPDPIGIGTHLPGGAIPSSCMEISL